MTDLQINDLTWQKQEENKFSPILKLWNKRSKEFNIIPLTDYLFSFKLDLNRYCTGFIKDGTYNECKFNNKLEKGYSGQCAYCEKIQGFKSAFIMGDLTHERSEEILSKEYFIYLGYFEPGILKVGTANTSRSSLRLIEQDCLIYTFIAKGNGYKVQKLEHLISKRFGVTENIKSGHKFKYLHIKPNEGQAKEKLNATFNKIKNEYLNTEYEDLFFNAISIKNLLKSNNIYFPDNYKKFEETNLYGTFEGLRGRYLLLENSNRIAAFDINLLIGRKIVEYLDYYEYNFNEEQLSLI